ncbi:MAG: hypothetical protein LBR66_06425 [Candidatus Symbiothrix sp.]|nr:hypothetical protein [Candidatus Symbiothrix sp.]
MKKELFIFLCLLLSVFSMQAQPPQGSGGRGMGDRQGPPPSGIGQRGESGRETTELRLDSFPEIPAITFEQRVDIGIILSKEQKDVLKLFEKKRELLDNEHQTTEMSETEHAKTQQKIAKIDGKIAKRKEKSNKKIKKLLSEEQYQIFLQKRHEFRFSNQRPPMSPQQRGSMNGREGMPPAGGGQRPDFRR